MTASFKAKLIAGFVLAFLAGGAAGAFFTFHQARHWRSDYGRQPHRLTERLRDRLNGELDLTSQQLAKIEPILDRAGKQLQEIRVQTGAEVRRVMAETNQALTPLLSDAQREKLARIEKVRRGKRGGHHPDRRRSPRGGEPDASTPGD